MSSFLRLVSFVHRLEGWTLAFCVGSLASLSIINVLGRTLFGVSLPFVEEVSRWCMLATTCVGLACAAGKARHVRMGALCDALPYRLRKALLTFIQAGVSLLLLYLAYLGVAYVNVVARLESVTPVLRVPLAYIYVVAPIGFALASLEFAMVCLRNCLSQGIFVSASQRERLHHNTEPSP